MKTSKNYIIGLALAILFLASANARAEIWRSDLALDDMIPIFSFHYDGTGAGSVRIHHEHLDSSLVDQLFTWNTAGFTFPNGLENTLHMWLQDGDGRDYITFSAAFTDTGGSSTLLDNLTINGDFPTGLGEFFHGLEEFLLAGELVNFAFGGNTLGQAFTFTLYGASATTPEPATLAMLGLGLAGLGIARRRMKK